MQKYHVTKCSRCETFSENFLRKCSHVMHIYHYVYACKKGSKKSKKYMWKWLQVLNSQQRVENIQQGFMQVHTMHCDAFTVLRACIISCTSKNNTDQWHVSFSGRSVCLSVCLTDCLFRHLRARLLVPSTHWWTIPRFTLKKDIKRPMLSQIMIVQDMPAINSSSC